jgi:hypothetical protein
MCHRELTDREVDALCEQGTVRARYLSLAERSEPIVRYYPPKPWRRVIADWLKGDRHGDR